MNGFLFVANLSRNRNQILQKKKEKKRDVNNNRKEGKNINLFIVVVIL